MAKLFEISPSDPVSAVALTGIQETCPILEDAEFYTRSGPSDQVKKAGGGSTAGIFRSQNEANNPTPRANTYVTAPKKIISFDAQADVILEDRNESPEEELADQTRLEARDAGYILQEKFFEGDDAVDAEEFDGVRVLTPAGNVEAPAAKIVLPLGGDAQKQAQQEAIETIINFFSAIPGGATHAYMNVLMRNRLLVVAKALGFYRQTKDELGNVVDRIGNTIIRSAGYAKSGADILPFTETVGTDTATSSIFACRWSERADLTVLTSVGLRGRFAGQSGNLITNNVNLDAALVLQDNNSLHQRKGFALA